MQYFHPDNMSSEEKNKIELAKVREEFKMSESDCGSARVQGKGSPFDVAIVRLLNSFGLLLQGPCL